MRRREFMAGSVPAALLLTRCTPPSARAADAEEEYSVALAHLERSAGRLGVVVIDSETNRHFGHRMDQRFAMCSTFKLPLAAMVLSAMDSGLLGADESLSFTAKDLVPHAPITAPNLSLGAMSILELAKAAQTHSDNVAANLLLRRLGGPQAFTRWCRELGDDVTRLDRWEPELNLVVDGDARDTTSPRAMAHLVSRFFDAHVLTEASRARLRRWMTETQTGAKRLRAGFPRTWQSGDKTGTSLGKGLPSYYNDIACVWFTNRAPLVVTCFFESSTETTDMRDEDQVVLAKVGHIAAHWARQTLGLPI